MPNDAPQVHHRPSNAVLWALLGLALIAAAFDLWDGYTAKTISTVGFVVGLASLLQARRYESSRWRMVAKLAFTLAIAAMLYRLAAWQGWM